MTVKQLIKRLEAIVKENGNVTVGVDWRALRDGSNGVHDIANVADVETHVVNQVDGDGFTIQNKDGTERVRITAIIS